MLSSADVILVADNVRVRYRNGALGILNVSFRVGPGDIIGIFGPNGAGKTSTVRAVSGFLKTEGAKIIQGSVTLCGVDVTNSEPHRQARLGLSFVPERDKVFSSLTVADNLAAVGRLPRGPRRKELHDLIFTLFPVLVDRKREVAGRLSGGQRQMLAIGRAMMMDPRILIVDEMTLGLHVSVQVSLFDAIRQIAAAGTAVVMVDESTGQTLDCINYCYMLSGGKVYDEGPPEKYIGKELLVAGYLDAGKS